MISKDLFSFKIYDSGILSLICLSVPFFPLCTGAVEFIDPSKPPSPTSPSSMTPLPLGASYRAWKKINRYNGIFSLQLLRNLSANQLL